MVIKIESNESLHYKAGDTFKKISASGQTCYFILVVDDVHIYSLVDLSNGRRTNQTYKKTNVTMSLKSNGYIKVDLILKEDKE